MEYFFKSSNLTTEIVAMFVLFKITLGAFPASNASCHLEAQRHQRSPSLKPIKLYSGIGVLKSFPTDFEKARKS